MKFAEEEKVLGNKAFATKKYNEAIYHYTKAIKLDHKNHLFYSNRSASYICEGKFVEATKDAKECIRLDPSFIKGYYRLATAQIKMNKYDNALTTIQHALQIDPKNSQMIKLNQLVNAKKSGTLNTPAELNKNSVINSCSHPIDQDISKEVDELQKQLQESIRDYNVVNIEIDKLQNEQRYNETTESELRKLPEDNDNNIYRRVGKMFMKSTRKDIYEILKEEMNDDKNRISDFSQKKLYLKHQIKSLQKNIRELTIEC